jgi:hypothetical protein
MGQQETAVTNKNRIMIYGPKNDGTYVVEFRKAEGVVALAEPSTFWDPRRGRKSHISQRH